VAGNVDFYQFRQSASGPISAMLDVPLGSVQMFIVLIDSNEEVISIATVSPGDEGWVSAQLDEGTYFIAVGAQDAGTQSTYSLSSERAIRPTGPPFLNCAIVQSYTFGATVNGSLASGDCVAPDGSLMDRYQFTLAEARRVTITLTSNEFDAYLYLFNSAGVILSQNDDSGGDLDSRISLSLPAGTYSIGASAFDEFESGGYTLRTQ
jgi:hypothetical protein